MKNMDYEKEYKSLVAKVKEAHRVTQTDSTKSVLEDILPQLRESEDERIRKGMIRFLESEQAEGMFTYEARQSWIAYLEKQKEHFRDDTKMVEKQDYSGLTDPERAIHRGFLVAGGKNVPVTIINETAQECLTQMKLAEWSEEDEKMLQRIIRHTESEYQDWCNDKYRNSEIVSDGKRSCLERLDWLEKRLKSLRPQPHWKPSKVQMNYLSAAVIDAKRRNDESTSGFPRYHVLKEIYEELLKL